MSIFQMMKLRFKEVNNHLDKKLAYLQILTACLFHHTVAATSKSMWSQGNTLGGDDVANLPSLCKQPASDLKQYEK